MFSQIMLVTFREGLEAFLVIAIAIIYLTQTQRRALLSAVYTGLLAALVLSAVLGVVLSRIGAMSPAWEGGMAIAAAVSVMYCILHMRRAGKTMKTDLTATLANTSHYSGTKAWWLTCGFSLFMVGREGVETATMIASLAQQTTTSNMAYAALAGVGLAGVLALAWVKFGRRVNLSRFFQVTAIFMWVFAAQLLLYGFHEFSEGGLLPVLDNAYWHDVTEPWTPEGEQGQWLSYALGILPLVWLIHGYWAGRRAAPSAV